MGMPEWSREKCGMGVPDSRSGVVEKKSVEEFSATPYLLAVINCMLWLEYGLPMINPHSILVVTINGTGFAIELFYVLVFSLFTDKSTRFKLLALLLLEMLFASGVAAFVLTVVHRHERRARIVGCFSVFITSLMYAAPLGIMKMVIKTRSVEYLPFFLAFTSFVNGLCWAVYGLIHFDVMIFIPNGLGALLGFIQLILHAVFYKSTKRQIEARNAKGEPDIPGLAEIVLIGDPKKACNVPQNGHSSQINLN
ncbi:hypothetical protein ACLOJK_010328 [Asimina triloba]